MEIVTAGIRALVLVSSLEWSPRVVDVDVDMDMDVDMDDDDVGRVRRLPSS